MQITFERIDQSYGGHSLFQQLDLVIPSGQFFTLLGPSGCGKTTLLRMLAGFVQPDRGRILFGDDDVTQVPVHRRDVGIVFQDYALFPDRSVLANVAYGLSARGVGKAEAKDQALAMLDRVGLKSLADRAPSALSGGQRQRVAMARALVIQPKLLLLDEPLSALDVKLRVELRGMIRALQCEAGITTVFVTHDQEEALALSDQIAVMNRGKVVQIGTPQAIYGKPTSAFAADFVGNANLLPVIRELEADEAGVRRLETSAGVLFTQCNRAWRPGALLAVRGSEIRVRDRSIPQPGELPGVVEQVEYRGDTVGYVVQTGLGSITVDEWASSQLPIRRRGDDVLLEMPRSALIVEAEPC